MPRFERSRERNSDSRDRPSRRDSGRDFEDRPSRRSSGRDFEDRPRGRRDSGRDSSRNSRNRRDFQMTKVTCSSCGNECEVPFKPTSNKPVYCEDCFAKNGKSSSNHSNKDLDKINEKLDKIMEALDIK